MKLKSLVVLLVVILVMLPASSYANQSSLTDNERYLKLGLTQDEINNFTPEQVEYYKGMNGHVISKETTYYRVTEGEDDLAVAVEVPKEVALSEIAQSEAQKNDETVSILGGGTDTKKTSWMTMTTTVSDINGTSPKEYLLKNSFTWLTNPFWTLTDVVGISHPEYIVPVQNSEIAAYTFDYYGTTNQYVGTHTNNLFTADKKNSNGMAFKIDILTGWGGGYQVWNHRGYMSYRVTRASNQYTTGTVFGHYTHTEVSITFGLSIGINAFGMSISGATSKTDMTDTGVTFTF
ncbi:hypothetical protein ACFOQM_00180 [Paenibacillus sp. GCM10012307]|uniref:Uncharacterized protein n=1 Tax=Paenibacillus roseus TaxID=2798579 RepID=A0A934IUU5_9BACL|nr:hypothetical protein [Paenibacillus roseus]MBJ6359746.1 hypothetical protein [Paenibacillus roseus]